MLFGVTQTGVVVEQQIRHRTIKELSAGCNRAPLSTCTTGSAPCLRSCARRYFTSRWRGDIAVLLGDSMDTLP